MAAMKKLGCPWRLVKVERLTEAAGGVGRKRSCCQSACAAIQGGQRLTKTFQPLQLNATAFSGGQLWVSHGSATGHTIPTAPAEALRPSPNPPDTAAPRWVICSWPKHSRLTAARLQVHPVREELEEEARCLDALGIEVRARRTTGTTGSGIQSGVSDSNIQRGQTVKLRQSHGTTLVFIKSKYHSK